MSIMTTKTIGVLNANQVGVALHTTRQSTRFPFPYATQRFARPIRTFGEGLDIEATQQVESMPDTVDAPTSPLGGQQAIATPGKPAKPRKPKKPLKVATGAATEAIAAPVEGSVVGVQSDLVAAIEEVPAISKPAASEPGQLTIDQFDPTIHDAIITICNPATGQHRTFKIETLRGAFCPGKRMVSLLDGPDNERDYKGFGWVDEFGVKVWGRFASQSRAGVAGWERELTIWEKYAAMVENPRKFRDRGLEYHISARCRRCNRVLTVGASVTSGYGPECLKKMEGGE